MGRWHACKSWVEKGGRVLGSVAEDLGRLFNSLWNVHMIIRLLA